MTIEGATTFNPQSWSPDGTKLVFFYNGSSSNRQDIGVLSLDGEKSRVHGGRVSPRATQIGGDVDARAIETSKAGATEYVPAHRSYVIGSVLFSVASLEAAINELFTDASEANLGKETAGDW